jgi:hypothetical protein
MTLWQSADLKRLAGHGCVSVARRKPWRILLHPLLLALSLTSCSNLPSDATVEKHFYRHQVEFEELATLIESAYRSIGRPYHADSYAAYLRTQPRYIDLLEAIGASSGVARITSTYSSEADRHLPDPNPYAISFELAEAGFFRAGLFGESKGIILFLTPPSFDRTNILITNTAKGDKVAGSDETNFYRQIEGDWYIYRDIDD